MHSNRYIFLIQMSRVFKYVFWIHLKYILNESDYNNNRRRLILRVPREIVTPKLGGTNNFSNLGADDPQSTAVANA